LQAYIISIGLFIVTAMEEPSLKLQRFLNIRK